MQHADSVRRGVLALGGAFALSRCLPARAADALAAPADAPWRLPGGDVQVVGDAVMAPVLQRLDALFTAAHPAVRFRTVLRPAPTGIDGIQAGVSLFAPMAQAAWDPDIESFRRLTGWVPMDVRIGRRGAVAPGQPRPPAFYVNAACPLRSLSLEEAGRVLTAGQPGGDLRHWAQLVDHPGWTQHAIHLYGTRDDGTVASRLRTEHFGGKPMAGHHEGLRTDADVLQAVAGDRFAIGVAGFVDAALVPRGVRMLALKAASEGSPPSMASPADVRAGRYPLSPFLHVYLPNAARAAIDPIAAEWLRAALSPAGQAAIAGVPGGAFFALRPDEAKAELEKLQPR